MLKMLKIVRLQKNNIFDNFSKIYLNYLNLFSPDKSYLSTNPFFPYSKNFCKTQPQFTLEQFVKEVNKILNEISDQLEDYDLNITENNSLTDGVLKLTFSGNKNYVLNIQRPNMQLWLSSPVSGPQRFEFDTQTNNWENIRNGKELLSILNEEINQMLKENNSSSKVELKLN